MEINQERIEYSVSRELVDLWIEVTYLRIVLNKILEKNPSLSENLSEDMFLPIKEEAIRIVGNKFGVIMQRAEKQ